MQPAFGVVCCIRAVSEPLTARSYREGMRSVVTALAVLFVLAGAARGATAWSEPVDVSPAGGNSLSGTVLVDRSGNATAFWERALDRFGDTRLETANRPAHGAFGAAATLAAGPVRGLAFALGPRGDTVAIWVETVVNGSIRAALRPAGGAWQPLDLPAEVTSSSSSLAPRLDAEGDLTLLWLTSARAAFELRVAERPVGGPWRTPQLLAQSAASSAQLATNARGDAVAVWEADGVVSAARRKAGRGFGRAQRLYAPDERTLPTRWSRLDPAGNFELVWTRRVTVAGSERLVLRGLVWRTKARKPGKIGTLSEPFGILPGSPMTVELAPNGAAVLAATHDRHGLELAYRAPGRVRFGSIRTVIPFDTSVWDVVAAVHGSGHAVVAWTRTAQPSRELAVEAAVRFPHSEFGEPHLLEAVGPGCPGILQRCGRPRAASAAVGRNEAIALWLGRPEPAPLSGEGAGAVGAAVFGFE